MSRIERAFRELAASSRRGLIVYLTAGDPNLAASREIAREVIRRGADIVELGIPFSDPTADGPAIQAAMTRALGAGVRPSDVLSLCADLRQEFDVPIVLFGYYNPIFIAGCERFADAAAQAGADGVLVVDLPVEEAGELVTPLRSHGLDLVPLIAPTSTPARIARAAEIGSGFLYYISLTGVTGARIADFDSAEESVRALRRNVALPIAVGFGISRPEDATRVASFADAVVVGTAVVRAAEQGGAAAAGATVAALRAALG